jgi:hypothetical protein
LDYAEPACKRSHSSLKKVHQANLMQQVVGIGEIFFRAEGNQIELWEPQSPA